MRRHVAMVREANTPESHGGATAAPPGRRERSKLEKRRRLVAAARALFSRKGFDGTTTSEIAARADIGAGTLFLYVQSKEELLALVFQEDMTRVRDEAFATLPRKNTTLLDEMVHVYAAMSVFHERDRMLARVFVKEVAFVREPNRAMLRDFMETHFAQSEARIEAAKARGELAHDVPVRTLSENLFATFFFSLQGALGADASVASPEYVATLRARLALQLRGLGPAERTSKPAHSPRAGRRPRTKGAA